MKGFGLMNSSIALVVLIGAANQFGLAQATHSASGATVQLMGKLEGQNSADVLAFSPDGKIVAAAYQGGAVVLWDVAKGEPRAIFKSQLFNPNTLVFSPDGKKLAVASGWESLNIWDLDKGRKVVDLQDRSGEGGLKWVAFTRDGKVMATGGLKFGLLRIMTGVLNLRETEEGKVQKTIRSVEDGPVNSGDFSPDGKTLALATGDRWSILKVSVEEWSEVGKVMAEHEGAPVEKGERSPHLIPHGRLKLVDIATGKVLKSLAAHEHSTEMVKFSPDGRTIATGGGDGVVKLWDTETWKERCKQNGHQGSIDSLAFSPDGKLLASADRYSVTLGCKERTGASRAVQADQGRKFGGICPARMHPGDGIPRRMGPLIQPSKGSHRIQCYQIVESADPSGAKITLMTARDSHFDLARRE